MTRASIRPSAIQRRVNREAEEREGILSGLDDADIVTGRVTSVRDDLTTDDGLVGFPKSRAQKLAESGQATEFDPEPHRDPDDPAFARYEADLRRRIEDR